MADGPLTPLGNLRGRTNENGYLRVAFGSGVQTVSGLTVTQGTLTADAQALSTTATWNAAGVTFTHWKAVITDTASAAGSKPINILGGAAGATTLFSVDKSGAVVAGANITTGDTFVVPAAGVYANISRGRLSFPSDGALTFSNNALAASATLTLPTGTTNVVPVVASDPATRKVGATNAQTIGSFTVGAADATFRVSANILVTTATTHSFTVTCAYTDEGNTSRTLTLNFSTLAGVISNTAIGNAAGAVPYNGVVQHIRCKAATTITIATTGTFTTVVYNGEGIIEKVT